MSSLLVNTECEYQMESLADIYIKFVVQRKSSLANQFK
jgi:hypothetical protein